MGHVRALLVAEGSGGHLIPALEVARQLADSGAGVDLLYLQRAPVAGLLDELLRDAQAAGVRIHPIAVVDKARGVPRLAWCLWHAAGIWRTAADVRRQHHTNVVAGFGGWVCVPVVAMARRHRIAVVLHEQNVRLGRANRWLRRWAHAVAISFDSPSRELDGTAAVLTGLPIRPAIGTIDRRAAAAALGLDPQATTLLIVGGSQGSQALNRLMIDVAGRLTEAERRGWQLVHLTGPLGAVEVQAAYAKAGLQGWIAPHLSRMEWAYALADVAVARSGASTMAELARCGVPAVLIPYPHAAGHQRDNAKLLQSAGAAVRLEERDTTPSRLLEQLRSLAINRTRRLRMRAQMLRFARPDAAEQLVSLIAHSAPEDDDAQR